MGVVGLGSFGRHHVRHYSLNDAARLTAVADVDAARAETFARDFGCEPFCDHRALIGNVDAVSIATPAADHARLARDFIAEGIHVFVEKPLAIEATDARDVAAQAAAAGVVLQVGHIERFSPAVRALREQVTSPRRIAAVRHAPWSGRIVDVDVVLDMMIHDIDHVLSFAGAPVASVSASGASAKGDLLDEAEAWLTFTNGVIATLSASRVAPKLERKLTITEPGRVFVADLATPSLAITSRWDRGAVANATIFPPHDNLAAEIAAFLASIRTGDAPEVDGRTGLAAVEVAERILAAIAESAAPIRLQG